MYCYTNYTGLIYNNYKNVHIKVKNNSGSTSTIIACILLKYELTKTKLLTTH